MESECTNNRSSRDPPSKELNLVDEVTIKDLQREEERGFADATTVAAEADLPDGQATANVKSNGSLDGSDEESDDVADNGTSSTSSLLHCSRLLWCRRVRLPCFPGDAAAESQDGNEDDDEDDENEDEDDEVRQTEAAPEAERSGPLGRTEETRGSDVTVEGGLKGGAQYETNDVDGGYSNLFSMFCLSL